MNGIEFDQDREYTNNLYAGQNEIPESWVYKVIYKLGLASDREGAQKIILIFLGIGIIVAGYFFYSTITAGNKYPFSPEEFKKIKEMMEKK